MTKLRLAQLADVEQIVVVHINAFQGFFLTHLGKRFLVELYCGFINDDSGILIVAEMENQIVGFAAGCINPEAFFSTLRNKRWPHFLLAAIPMVCRQPAFVVKKLVNALFYKGESPSQLISGVLLSSFAVAPTWSGAGIGQMLLVEFCAKAEALGGKNVYVITDQNDNASVNIFYRKAGFIIESTFSKTGNRQMNRLIKNLS
jgi:ribosomal protein S18 acetylase RimI-like enzyme